jgi:hypothetical protein
MIFIDLKKVYDKILKNIIWWTLEKKIAPTRTLLLSKICCK